MKKVRLITVFYTLFYLKPIQIYGRVFFVFKRKFIKVGNFNNISYNAGLLKQLFKSNIPDILEFDFLNMKQKYLSNDISWIDTNKEKLWRYNLSYYDFLNDKSDFDFNTKIYLILDWIENNTNDRDETWEPYVISKRIVNWIKFLEKFDNHLTDSLKEFKQIITISIFYQAKRLCWDIEYHILANHLFENLKAIFMTSIYLLKQDSCVLNKNDIVKWLDISVKYLITQFDEQIFPDGGHYELSPMYHETILSGILDIKVNCENILEGDYYSTKKKRIKNLLDKCNTIIPKMQEWLSWMIHPDGEIALFNDSVFPEILVKKNEPVKEGIRLFGISGYFIKKWENNYFVIDCGLPSPSYQPGHSHCDALSYELSLKGYRVIVDTGCGSYQDEHIRHYCRKTSAHNVPMIENIEQSEIWGNFRMGRRSVVINKGYNEAIGLFECRIKDYLGNIFLRKIYLKNNFIIINDFLEKSRCDGIFQSSVHISPDIEILKFTDGKTCLKVNNFDARITSGNRFEICNSNYYPEFNKRRENKVIYFYGSKNEIQYNIEF